MNPDEMDTLKNKITELNEDLAKMGMLQLEIISPFQCKPRDKNARYFETGKFRQLVSNIKQTGTLESVPLVHRMENGKIEIISGHHRVEAAKEANLEQILVMVIPVESEDQIISKQLPHNALAGQDDKLILKELFDSISDISLRICTGLQDEIDAIAYDTINFRVGAFKEFTVMFLPEDIGIYDETMEQITNDMLSSRQAAYRLTSMAYFDKFAKAIRTIKKAENIKSNGVALLRLVELAQEKIEECLTPARKSSSS